MPEVELDIFDVDSIDEERIGFMVHWKTAVIVKRRAYVGNIMLPGGQVFEDRMMKSPLNQFDKFPDDNFHYVDVVVGDGDEIVHLEAFGDQILQFKRKYLYIIEVTDEGEEVIGSYQGYGIENHGQVTQTKHGVAWATSGGAYLYDGEDIIDLSKDSLASGRPHKLPRGVVI